MEPWPEIDHTGVRKGLLYVHKANLPKFIFDGTILFTTTRLSPDDKPIVLTSKRESDGTMVEIIIKLVAEVQPTDYHYMQFFNIVLRQAMEKMQLELIRRNRSCSVVRSVARCSGPTLSLSRSRRSTKGPPVALVSSHLWRKRCWEP